VFEISYFGFRISYFGFRISYFVFWVLSLVFRVSSYQGRDLLDCPALEEGHLRKVDCQCEMHRLLAGRILFAGLLFIVYCLLFIVYFPSFIVHCSLFIVLWFAVWCVLLTSPVIILYFM